MGINVREVLSIFSVFVPHRLEELPRRLVKVIVIVAWLPTIDLCCVVSVCMQHGLVAAAVEWLQQALDVVNEPPLGVSLQR